MTIKLSARICIVVCLSIQLFLLGIIVVSYMGIDFAFARQLVGFLYLTLVPGVIMLTILGANKSSLIENMIYSVGISLGFVMFGGFMINLVLPGWGIERPMLLTPLFLSFLSLTLTMTLFSLVFNWRKGDLDNGKNYVLDKQTFLVVGLCVLIVLVVVFAGLIVDLSSNCLIIVIASLCVLFFMIGNINLRESDYICFLFAIALGLLYHVTIPSPSLPFLNLDSEYWYQVQVLGQGFWDMSLRHSVNSTLSTVMLTPIFTLFLDISSISVWKFVFPIFFALIPVAMYKFYSKSFDKRLAFLACVFFVFSFMFYELGATIRRQMVAMLYFAMILMLISDKGILRGKREGLLVIFVLSLMVSHYATAYIVIGFLVLSTILAHIVVRLNTKNELLISLKDKINQKNVYIPSVVLILMSVVFGFSWYMYTSSGVQFTSLVMVGEHLYNSMKTFFEPSTRYEMIGSALGVGFWDVSMVGKVYRIVQYFSQLCLVVGVITLVASPKYKDECPQFLLWSLVAFLVLGLSIVLPVLSKMLHIHRLYFFALIILSPCFVIGFNALINALSKVVLKIVKKKRLPNGFSLRLVSVYLVVYFMFHSGFVFAVMDLSLSSNHTSEIPFSDSLSFSAIDTRYGNYYEIAGAKFYGEFGVREIVGDYRAGKTLLNCWYNGDVSNFSSLSDLKKSESFVFLRTWNIKRGELLLTNPLNNSWGCVSLAISDGVPRPMLIKNKIYCNNGAIILE